MDPVPYNYPKYVCAVIVLPKLANENKLFQGFCANGNGYSICWYTRGCFGILPKNIA